MLFEHVSVCVLCVCFVCVLCVRVCFLCVCFVCVCVFCVLAQLLLVSTSKTFSKASSVLCFQFTADFRLFSTVARKYCGNYCWTHPSNWRNTLLHTETAMHVPPFQAVGSWEPLTLVFNLLSGRNKARWHDWWRRGHDVSNGNQWCAKSAGDKVVFSTRQNRRS